MPLEAMAAASEEEESHGIGRPSLRSNGIGRSSLSFDLRVTTHPATFWVQVQSKTASPSLLQALPCPCSHRSPCQLALPRPAPLGLNP